MTKIVFIRHIQAEGNLFRVMQGHWDGEATALGLRQAEALARRFRAVPFDAIYTSDLSRARLTAEALHRGRGVPLIADPRLRELNMGAWEGRFFGDLKHERPSEIRQFLLRDEDWCVPGAESYADVAKRTRAALEEILRAHEGGRVAVVSHGVAIRALLASVLELDTADPRALPIGGNTAVSQLSWENGAFSVDFLGDCSHLEAALAPEWESVPDLRAEPIDPLAEADFYTACYADAWRCAHGSLRGFRPEPYLNAACEHHRADPQAVLRVYDGDEPAGLVDMDTQRGAHAGIGWLSLVYLRPAYRRRGMGIQLLGRAILHYRRLGRRSLRLVAAEENGAALAFYEHWGFQRLSREGGCGDGLWLLEKKLGGAGYV